MIGALLACARGAASLVAAPSVLSGEPQELRIEVEISALGVEGARWAGAGEGERFRVDDTALGISLQDRVRQRCGANATRCELPVLAQWRDDGLVVLRVLE